MWVVVAAALAMAAGSGAAASDAPDFAPGARSCLAEAVYHEARGTTDRAAVAVAHVVLNRRESEDFPDTVCGVIGDECQFSYRCDHHPDALSDPDERARAFEAAEAAMDGAVADPTDGALFFHSDGIDPGWFATRDRTAEIGGNVFYR